VEENDPGNGHYRSATRQNGWNCRERPAFLKE
jgi:hypothetical protein